MRLVFAGTPATAVPSLEALLTSRHEVAAVVTRPDAPAGRGLRLAPSPVAQPRPRRPGSRCSSRPGPATRTSWTGCGRSRPDCCPVTAYGALIPQRALDIPGHGWVNLHFSLLPAWRGAAPVQHAILHGDDVTGATTFRIVAALDAGPVFGVRDRAGPAGRHRGRPAGPAGRLRGRAAGRDPRRHRVRRAGRAAAARRRGEPGARRSPPRTPGCAGPARPPRSAARSARAPPRRAPGPRWTAPGSSCGRSPASRPATSPAAGSARGSCACGVAGAGRHRHPAGAARRRAAARQAADARGRLGPGPAAGRARPRCSAEQCAPARRRGGPPARPHRGRPPGRPRAAGPTRPAASPSTCCARSPSGTPTPTCCCPRCSRERGLTGRDAALATELTYGTLRGRGSYDAILGHLPRPGPGPASTRRCARCSGSARTSCWPPGSARTPRSPPRWTWPGTWPARGRPGSSTRCCAGSPPGTWRAGWRSPPRAGPPTWSATCRSGTAIRAGSSARWARRSARSPAAGLAETEAALAADDERPRVTLCAVPGLADPAELAAAGAAPARWSPFGAYLAERRPGADRGGGAGPGGGPGRGQPARRARAGPGRRGRAATAGRRRPVARPVRRARAARRGCSPGWPRRAGRALLAADVRPHRARLAARRPAGGRRRRRPWWPPTGPLPAWRPGSFDRVLADVPCSGLGALRRRPEARWRRSPEDVAALGPLQRALLAAALDSAAPGRRRRLRHLLAAPRRDPRRGGGRAGRPRTTSRCSTRPRSCPRSPACAARTPHGAFAQFWPHRHGTDAIFLALLRRPAAARAAARPARAGRRVPVDASDRGGERAAAPAGRPGRCRCRPAGPRRSRPGSRCRCR